MGTLKYKVGDYVRIKPKEYFDTLHGDLDVNGFYCPTSMRKYAGEIYRITRISENRNVYKLQNTANDAGGWWYTDEQLLMVTAPKKPHTDKRVIKIYNLWRNMKEDGFESKLIDNILSKIRLNPDGVSEELSQSYRYANKLEECILYCFECVLRGENSEVFSYYNSKDIIKWTSYFISK